MSSGISVVIPVRNGAPFLEEALASVRGQSVTPSEVIVVDDGSEDHTPEIARAAGVVYIRQDPAGQAIARNVGAARATGPLLAFLDADDVWPADKLALQLRGMAEEPEMDAVFGQAVEFRKRDGHGVFPLAPPVAAYVPGAMLIKHASFWRTGPFAASWRVGEVIDWYARAGDVGLKMRTLPATVLWRRIHDDNLGRRAPNPEADYLAVMRGIIARRRKG